jgi:hypothetical protein
MIGKKFVEKMPRLVMEEVKTEKSATPETARDIGVWTCGPAVSLGSAQIPEDTETGPLKG